MVALVINKNQQLWVSGDDNDKIQKINPKCQVIFYVEDIVIDPLKMNDEQKETNVLAKQIFNGQKYYKFKLTLNEHTKDPNKKYIYAGFNQVEAH